MQTSNEYAREMYKMMETMEWKACEFLHHKILEVTTTLKHQVSFPVKDLTDKLKHTSFEDFSEFLRNNKNLDCYLAEGPSMVKVLIINIQQ